MVTKSQGAGQESAVDKTITIDGYVVWRIPNREAADRFVRTFGSIERAEQYLQDKIRGDLGGEIPKLSLEDLHTIASGVVDKNRNSLSERLLWPHRFARSRTTVTRA